MIWEKIVQITLRGETERQGERNEGGGRGGMVLEREGERKVGRERERVVRVQLSFSSP